MNVVLSPFETVLAIFNGQSDLDFIFNCRGFLVGLECQRHWVFAVDCTLERVLISKFEDELLFNAKILEIMYQLFSWIEFATLALAFVCYTLYWKSRCILLVAHVYEAFLLLFLDVLIIFNSV